MKWLDWLKKAPSPKAVVKKQDSKSKIEKTSTTHKLNLNKKQINLNKIQNTKSKLKENIKHRKILESYKTKNSKIKIERTKK